MAYHYSVPPQGYVVYDYSSTSTSPSPDNPAYDYYHPYQSPISSPTGVRPTTKRQHARTGSYNAPRMSGWHSPAGYPSPGFYSAMPNYTSPPAAYDNVPVYEQVADATPTRSRARRSSTTTRPKTTSSPKKPFKPAPIATAEHAALHKIPSGYSLKNWDPTEKPILLLGSVFDANSVGKWIYDWTVYHHKAGSPLTEVAGELWLLLIKFAGKMKRAEECLSRVRHPDNIVMVEDFIHSGDRIWLKMKDLLKYCEEYMWSAAKKDGSKGKIQMGEKSGIEFVKSIFGRERELERTERLMQSIRLWNMRFDSNCEEILRKPSHY